MKVRMISITRQWLWLVLAAAFAGPAAAAGPNYSTSTASHEPAKVIAGDVVRYTVTVTDAGGAADYTRLTTTLPRSYSFAPAATVPPPSATAIELFGTRGRSRPARAGNARSTFSPAARRRVRWRRSLPRSRHIPPVTFASKRGPNSRRRRTRTPSALDGSASRVPDWW